MRFTLDSMTDLFQKLLRVVPGNRDRRDGWFVHCLRSSGVFICWVSGYIAISCMFTFGMIPHLRVVGSPGYLLINCTLPR